jgi:hypothetical protein
MEKTFTLDDLNLYFREIRRTEYKAQAKRKIAAGPSKFTLNALLSYSRALEVLKSSSAGTFYHLAN